MEKNDILKIIQQEVAIVMPHLRAEIITENTSLRSLGANSLDRTEIALLSMRELKLNIPLIELANVNTINDLITLFYGHLKK